MNLLETAGVSIKMRLGAILLSLGLCLPLSYGTVAAAAGSPEAAEAELKKNPRNLPLRQKLGEYYFDKKDFKKAIDILAPYSNEISAESLRILAEAYEQQSDRLNQIRTLEMYKGKQPEMFRPHYLLGVAYFKNKQLDESVANLRQAIRYAPKHRPSYEALLAVFEETKQSYESRVLVADMIRVFGKRKEFLTLQCKLHMEDGFLAEAHKLCKEAVASDPREPDNHVHLAQTFVYLNNKKGAEKVFITASRQFPDSEYVQWATGEYYYQEKNFPIATRYLKAAVKADPKKARSQLALALALFEGKDYEEALPHYTAACELDDKKIAEDALRTAAAKLRQVRNLSLIHI